MISLTLSKVINTFAPVNLLVENPRNNNRISQPSQKMLQSDTSENESTNIHQIQPFDSAFIAYQMMGLNDR